MEKEYNKYLWSPKQPRVYGISPLTISGTPMSEEDVATSLKVENSQQRFQQNPIVKRSEQWEAQQKQREEEIAASKKWLELHPEDESDSPYTILERGKHQAIVDGKDPSYYEKMIDDGKQFTKGALSVLSLPYLSAAAVGAYGYGASLGARGLFAAQGIHGLANENGVRKTANLIKSGDYGRAALSGTGDVLNAAMILPGAKFLGSVAKYGLKPAVVGDMLGQNIRYVPQSGKFFYNNETIQENRIPVGAYRQSPEQMAEKINQLNTKGFTVLGHGTGFGGQEAAKNIEREGLKIFKRDGTGLVEDADITNTASFLGGPDTATNLSNWPHLNSRYISIFPSSEFRYVNGNRRYFDLFPKGTFEYIPEKSGKSLLDYEPGGWSVVEGKGGITKPSASIGYYDSKEGIFYPNSNYQYKPYSPKSKERTYLGLLERPSKLSEAERLGISKGARNQPDNTALPTRGFDVIPTNKNNFYRVSGPSEITDISEFGKLRIDPIARFDQMQLRIINEQTGIPMERLYEINASDNPRAIQNLVMESEAYKSASPFDQFNMKLSAARPKSNHGDKGFQRGAFFSIYDPNNPASKYYGAPTIVGTTRKSSFLGGHHGDYRGEWNLDIPVGSGQNTGSAVLRSGFEKENFKYWKLGNDGKWYLHNFKQGGILKRK